ncbi:uncharacterized protein LOC134537079 isoform X2 [Bacillus rossius redtenbacheri]|uniref:uncharacterized protein LOC134537079 isoform X2 n=1 Tax=Bacillus rossius redtenbacheri TaxID=93214 RepID=UPI002FDDD6CF
MAELDYYGVLGLAPSSLASEATADSRGAPRSKQDGGAGLLRRAGADARLLRPRRGARVPPPGAAAAPPARAARVGAAVRAGGRGLRRAGRPGAARRVRPVRRGGAEARLGAWQTRLRLPRRPPAHVPRVLRHRQPVRRPLGLRAGAPVELRFSREGHNLVMVHTLELQDALTGCTVVVSTLDDKTLRVPITEVTAPGYQKVVPGEGMPHATDRHQRGDLIIRFNVKYPQYLSEASRRLVQTALKKKAWRNQPEDIYRIIMQDKMRRITDKEWVQD